MHASEIREGESYVGGGACETRLVTKLELRPAGGWPARLTYRRTMTSFGRIVKDPERTTNLESFARWADYVESDCRF